MKLIIQPQPGDTRTPYQRFEDFAKQVFAVPKEDVDKRRAEYERKKKRRSQKDTVIECEVKDDLL